jgi:NAD-dependent dihydropyrimidine dehydrogenase PreA subunit
MLEKGTLRIDYGPTIDYRHCSGCGECYRECPMDVFAWDEEKKMPVAAYPAECRFCVVCELECPERAIDVTLPLEVMSEFYIFPEKPKD